MQTMVRLATLSEPKVFFPISQLRAVPAGRRGPFAVGRNLENRLITFALRSGARSAFLRVVKGITMLVVRDSGAREIATAITGSANEWHQALDKLESMDEDDCAGLHRYLKPSASLNCGPRAYGLAA